MGSVPLGAGGNAAAEELERAVTTLGLKGVEVLAHVGDKELSDPEFEPFWKKVEALGAVVFIHPHGFPQPERFRRFYFNNVIGNPLESTVAVSHLIFDGVMARHPKLKVLVAHGGGFIAHYWARMDHAWRARPDTRTVIQRKPSSYLEKFYFDTITHDPQMVKRLIDRFGADHVILGTDYPYDMADDDPLGTMAEIQRLPKADRELVVGGNAARLLKIKPHRLVRRRRGLRSVHHDGQHGVVAHDAHEVHHALLPQRLATVSPGHVADAPVPQHLLREVVHQGLVGPLGVGAAAFGQGLHHFGGDAFAHRDGRVDGPLHLLHPVAGRDQDGQFRQAQTDGAAVAQVLPRALHVRAELGAAQQGHERFDQRPTGPLDDFLGAHTLRLGPGGRRQRRQAVSGVT